MSTVRQRRRIGAYGICHDGTGRLLLVRGAPGSNEPGVWQMPGGGVDHGEDPAHAVVREYVEETGLAIEIDRLRDVRSDLETLPRRRQIVHHDRILYDVHVIGGALRDEVGGSTDLVAWFEPAELAALPLLSWVARVLGLAGPDAHPPAGSPKVRRMSLVTRGATTVQRFSAYGLVRDPAGRLLLTRISPAYPGGGSWHLPGGGTDFGEQATEALVRELREETGQVGEVGALLTVVHAHNPRAYGPEKRTLDWHTVRAIFRVTVTEPSVPMVIDRGGSTDQAAWFTPEEARELNLNKLARSVIAAYGH